MFSAMRRTGTPTASISAVSSMAGSVDRGHHAPSSAPLEQPFGLRLRRAERSRALTLGASLWSDLVARTDVTVTFLSRHEPQPVSWLGRERRRRGCRAHEE